MAIRCAPAAATYTHMGVGKCLSGPTPSYSGGAEYSVAMLYGGGCVGFNASAANCKEVCSYESLCVGIRHQVQSNGLQLCSFYYDTRPLVPTPLSDLNCYNDFSFDFKVCDHRSANAPGCSIGPINKSSTTHVAPPYGDCYAKDPSGPAPPCPPAQPSPPPWYGVGGDGGDGGSSGAGVIAGAAGGGGALLAALGVFLWWRRRRNAAGSDSDSAGAGTVPAKQAQQGIEPVQIVTKVGGDGAVAKKAGRQARLADQPKDDGRMTPIKGVRDAELMSLIAAAKATGIQCDADACVTCPLYTRTRSRALTRTPTHTRTRTEPRIRS